MDTDKILDLRDRVSKLENGMSNLVDKIESIDNRGEAQWNLLRSNEGCTIRMEAKLDHMSAAIQDGKKNTSTIVGWIVAGLFAVALALVGFLK